MKPSNKTKDKFYLPIPLETESGNKQLLNAAFKVHSALGPGLLESAYEACLVYELNKIGLTSQNQVVLPIIYGKEKIDAGYRVDLLIENSVIAELKAVEDIIPLYEAQLLTYMKLSDIRLGFLLNFNVAKLKDGIKRMVN